MIESTPFEIEFRRDISNAKRKIGAQSTSFGRNKFDRNLEIAKFIHKHFSPSSVEKVREHNSLVRAALLYEINDFSKVNDTQVKGILKKATAVSVARGQWDELARLKQAGDLDANGLVLQLGTTWSAIQSVKNGTLKPSPVERNILAKAALETHSLVADRLGLYNIKEELQEDAFRLGHPDVQRQVEHAIRSEADKHSKNIGEIKQLLWTVAEKLNPIDKPELGIGHHEIHGRVKQPYSVWKKINDFERYPEMREIRSIEERVEKLHDLFGFRVILHNTNPASCHTYTDKLLELAENKGWKLEGGRKDYVTAPKNNGYRSIHLKLVKGKRAVEIQIRTKDMHLHAESGDVNHSLYQAKGKGDRDGSHLTELFDELGTKGAETASIKHSFTISGDNSITQHTLSHRHTVADAIGYALIDRRKPGQTTNDALKLLKEGKFGAVIKRGKEQLPVTDLRKLVERGDHIEFNPEHMQVHTIEEVKRAVKSKELQRHMNPEKIKKKK